jgi:hypothetical protein
MFRRDSRREEDVDGDAAYVVGAAGDMCLAPWVRQGEGKNKRKDSRGG